MNGQTEAVSTWSKLVHNKNITMDEVKDAYKDWAASYDAHFDLLHENRADHLVQLLKNLLISTGKKDLSKVSILDVAAGTGIVGEGLAKAGFKNITALDFSGEMLEVAQQKGCYTDFMECSFANTIPDGLEPRSYDAVIMMGGFAAGHLPLASLHTMARICKKGGIVINSMTLQYTHFVNEYKDINEYVEELGQSGVWKVMKREILDNYIKGKQGLVHAMQVL